MRVSGNLFVYFTIVDVMWPFLLGWWLEICGKTKEEIINKSLWCGWDQAQTFPLRTGTCLPFLHRFVKSLRWLRELWVARCPPSDLRDYSNLCWLIWLIRFISTRPQSSRRTRGKRTRRSLRNANKHPVLFLCLWGLWAFTDKKDIPPPLPPSGNGHQHHVWGVWLAKVI